MAETTNNGATNGDRPGSNPLQNPGVTTGSTDPMATAEAGYAQTQSALKSELEPKPLDSVQRKQTLKLGKKREALIGLWLKKAVKTPELAPGQDPQALLDEFNLVVRIQALVTGFRGLTRLGEDTVLVRLTELWKSVMDIYGIAPHLRTSDPEVADLIAQTL